MTHDREQLHEQMAEFVRTVADQPLVADAAGVLVADLVEEFPELGQRVVGTALMYIAFYLGTGAQELAEAQQGVSVAKTYLALVAAAGRLLYLDPSAGADRPAASGDRRSPAGTARWPAGFFVAPQDARILELVGQGLTVPQIATRLGVTVAAVRAGLGRLRSKFRAADRVSLVANAVMRGYLVPSVDRGHLVTAPPATPPGSRDAAHRPAGRVAHHHF